LSIIERKARKYRDIIAISFFYADKTAVLINKKGEGIEIRGVYDFDFTDSEGRLYVRHPYGFKYIVPADKPMECYLSPDRTLIVCSQKKKR